MDKKKNTCYLNLRETYGSNISLMGALKGLQRSFDPNEVCFCKESLDPRISLPKEGACFYQQKCSDCDINKTNQCDFS